jgi:hypothetical protein
MTKQKEALEVLNKLQAGGLDEEERYRSFKFIRAVLTEQNTDPDTEVSEEYVMIKRSELALVMLALDTAAENASDLALHLHADQWDEALKILETALEKK